MSPRQIALVQGSWRQVKPIGDAAAELFYARLFDLEPSVRALFKGDMQEQGRKLMAMIGIAVGSLEHLEGMVPAVQALGRRHARYGVQERHYEVVGEALVWTLEQGLRASIMKEARESAYA
jgi:hemoglobin-like flavoprotein